jgi:hypothetical protein
MIEECGKSGKTAPINQSFGVLLKQVFAQILRSMPYQQSANLAQSQTVIHFT